MRVTRRIGKEMGSGYMVFVGMAVENHVDDGKIILARDEAKARVDKKGSLLPSNRKCIAVGKLAVLITKEHGNGSDLPFR
jgi:hypothetical protein